MPWKPKPSADDPNPLLTWNEIEVILKFLDLTPRQAGLLLGGGPKAFLKYSKQPGAITRSMSNLLRCGATLAANSHRVGEGCRVVLRRYGQL